MLFYVRAYLTDMWVCQDLRPDREYAIDWKLSDQRGPTPTYCFLTKLSNEKQTAYKPLEP